MLRGLQVADRRAEVDLAGLRVVALRRDVVPLVPRQLQDDRVATADVGDDLVPVDPGLRARGDTHARQDGRLGGEPRHPALRGPAGVPRQLLDLGRGRGSSHLLGELEGRDGAALGPGVGVAGVGQRLLGVPQCPTTRATAA
jgi:hypothetical protein